MLTYGFYTVVIGMSFPSETGVAKVRLQGGIIGKV